MKMNGPIEILPQNDGWANILTGYGLASTDKRMSTKFVMEETLDSETLLSIYRGDGLGRRMIDVPVDDMVRNWFRIEADSENKVVNYLDKLSTPKYIKSALRWADLFGGSLIFMGINDGQAADMPVKEKQIQDISFFKVYDKRSIQWLVQDLYTDPKEEKYGQPQWYTCTNSTTGMPQKIHESRCLIFDGEDLPERERHANQGWGDSRLQSLFTRLRGVCDSLGGVETINSEFILSVMKISGLSGYLTTKEGEQKLRDRLRIMDMTKSMNSTMIMDTSEEFERASSFGVSGLRELIDVLIDVMCGVSGIPRVKLVGDQSKGLGGEAAGNLRMYYDEILSKQNDKLTPALAKLIKYTMLCKKVHGKELENWKITYNDLWVPTEKETAETRLLNAKHDAMYMDYGLPAEYVIASRFGGKSYSNDLTLPDDYIEELLTTPLSEVEDRIEELVKVKTAPKGNAPMSETKSNGTDPGQTSKDNPGVE